MGSRIYVGGLLYAADEPQLGELFAAHGTVASVRVITDKIMGRYMGSRSRRKWHRSARKASSWI